MKEKQIDVQIISNDLQKILTQLTQDVAGITGLASVYGLQKEADKLVDYRISIQEMLFGERAYNSALSEMAQQMVLTTNEKIEKIKKEQSARNNKLCKSGDEIEFFCDSTYTPTTKGNFCRILGGDASTDESNTSSDE